MTDRDPTQSIDFSAWFSRMHTKTPPTPRSTGYWDFVMRDTRGGHCTLSTDGKFSDALKRANENGRAYFKKGEYSISLQ